MSKSKISNCRGSIAAVLQATGSKSVDSLVQRVWSILRGIIYLKIIALPLDL